MSKKILPALALVSVTVALLVLTLFPQQGSNGPDPSANVNPTPETAAPAPANGLQVSAKAIAPTEETFRVSEDQTQIIVDTRNIGSRAFFYTYPVGDAKVEFFVVRAGDGSIRLALNTCQVCHGSPKSYFVQIGSSFVCQNCGNSFNSMQIGNETQGCSPMPIPLGAYSWNGDHIFVETAFLEQHAADFRNIRKM